MGKPHSGFDARGEENVVKVETQAPAPWRMPSATAIPSTIDKCALLRPTVQTQTVELHYGFSGLPPEQASACRLLTLRWGHWTVENGNHLSRDLRLLEDNGRIRTGTEAAAAGRRDLAEEIDTDAPGKPQSTTLRLTDQRREPFAAPTANPRKAQPPIWHLPRHSRAGSSR